MKKLRELHCKDRAGTVDIKNKTKHCHFRPIHMLQHYQLNNSKSYDKLFYYTFLEGSLMNHF